MKSILAIALAILIIQPTLLNADTLSATSLKTLSRTNASLIGLSADCGASANTSALLLERLIDAIAVVESNGRTNVMGDNGLAAGKWQLHKCAVLDVNKHYKTSYRWPKDCFDEIKARRIAKLYLILYAPPNATLEMLVRNFNGGPHGWKKKCTERYWRKVKAALVTLY